MATWLEGRLLALGDTVEGHGVGVRTGAAAWVVSLRAPRGRLTYGSGAEAGLGSWGQAQLSQAGCRRKTTRSKAARQQGLTHPRGPLSSHAEPCLRIYSSHSTLTSALFNISHLLRIFMA